MLSSKRRRLTLDCQISWGAVTEEVQGATTTPIAAPASSSGTGSALAADGQDDTNSALGSTGWPSAPSSYGSSSSRAAGPVRPATSTRRAAAAGSKSDAGARQDGTDFWRGRTASTTPTEKTARVRATWKSSRCDPIPRTGAQGHVQAHRAAGRPVAAPLGRTPRRNQLRARAGVLRPRSFSGLVAARSPRGRGVLPARDVRGARARAQRRPRQRERRDGGVQAREPDRARPMAAYDGPAARRARQAAARSAPRAWSPPAAQAARGCGAGDRPIAPRSWCSSRGRPGRRPCRPAWRRRPRRRTRSRLASKTTARRPWATPPASR